MYHTVSLVHTTPDAEKLIAYMARVSNPDNQDNPESERLIRYLIKHKHWSPFEMVNMCVQIRSSGGTCVDSSIEKARYKEQTE